MPSAEMQRAAGERARGDGATELHPRAPRRPGLQIRELLEPAGRRTTGGRRRSAGGGGGGGPAGRRTTGEPPARKDEEYRRVRRTGNDEEAVRGTGARLARANPGCGAGVAGWGF